jgi:hypothetical protein
MTEFEKFVTLYRRRADVQDGEITFMEGWRDAFAAGRRAGMDGTIKIITSHYSGSGEMTDTDYVLAHIISDMGLTRYD